jgi:hypothetical protein
MIEYTETIRKSCLHYMNRKIEALSVAWSRMLLRRHCKHSVILTNIIENANTIVMLFKSTLNLYEQDNVSSAYSMEQSDVCYADDIQYTHRTMWTLAWRRMLLRRHCMHHAILTNIIENANTVLMLLNAILMLHHSNAIQIYIHATPW